MNQVVKLFVPMLLSNVILILSGVVDIAFLGHFSNDHVAALSVILSLYTVVYVIGIGILQGVLLKLSEAFGRRDIPRIRQIFMQGAWLMLISSLVGIVLLFALQDFPKWFGASAHVVSIAKDCIWVLVFGLPSHLFLRLFATLSQVTENAKKVLLSDSLQFILKIILSYLLIFGVDFLSIPPLGAVGTVLSGVIVRWFMLLMYYLFLLERHYLFSEAAMSQADLTPSLVAILKIGIPTAVMVLIDVIAFCSVAVLLLPLGSVVVAAHQIATSTGALMYIIPSSIAAAYSIILSRQMGENEMEQVEKTAMQSIKVVIVVSACLSLFVWIGRDFIATLYSDDSAVQLLGVSLLVIVCMYHILDSLLSLFTSLLRCWDISILPMLIFLVVVLFLGLGGGWWLAYQGLHLGSLSISAQGIYGFWMMAAISYSVACLLSVLCFRFRKQLKGF